MPAGRTRDALTLGPWRRRRQMRHALARLDEPAWADQPRATGSERLRSIVVVASVIALLVMAWRFNSPPGSFHSASGSDSVELLPAGPVARGLARPEEVRTDDGVYRFRLVRIDDDSPVTYDACQPVRLVVNPSGAPAAAAGLVEEAAAEIEAASGLTLMIVGETDERPSEDRPLAIARYGTGWAPALITWSDPDETPRLGGDVAGLAGSGYARRGDDVAYVSGTVTLDAPQLDAALAAGERDSTRAIIVHELAHLVGLQHVSDPDELMYPQSQPGVTSLQPGDLAGLAALGAGACVNW